MRFKCIVITFYGCLPFLYTALWLSDESKAPAKRNSMCDEKQKKISGLIRLNETDKYLLLFQGINIVQANGLFANYMQSIVKTKPKMWIWREKPSKKIGKLYIKLFDLNWRKKDFFFISTEFRIKLSILHKWKKAEN